MIKQILAFSSYNYRIVSMTKQTESHNLIRNVHDSRSFHELGKDGNGFPQPDKGLASIMMLRGICVLT